MNYLDWKALSQRPAGSNNSIPSSVQPGNTAPYSSAVATAQGANTEATQLQIAAQEKAMQQYLEWMQKALDQQQQSGNNSTMAQLLGAQLGMQQMQQGMIPMQTAALSGLQSLPILQKMAGVQAYAMPKSINTTVPNYVQQFQDILNGGGGVGGGSMRATPALYSGAGDGGYKRFTPDQLAATQADLTNRLSGSQPQGNMSYELAMQGRPAAPANGNTIVDYGFLPGAAGPTGPSAPMSGGAGAAPAQGGGSSVNLQPIDPEVNIQESELYKWQQAENQRKLRQTLAARGILSGGAGAELENRANNALSAQESANQYNRVMDLVKIGMGAAGQAGNWTQQMGQVPINLGSNIGGTQMQMGQGLSGLYGGIGGTQMGITQGIGALGGNNLISNAQLGLQEAMMRNNPYLIGGMNFGFGGAGGGGMYGGGGVPPFYGMF